MMRVHPDRQAIFEEIHARPVVIVPETARLRRLVYLPAGAGSGVQSVLAAIQDWCATRALPAPESHTRQHTFAPKDPDIRDVTWEFHNEFVSVTWAAGLDDATSYPVSIGLEVLENYLLICAMRVDVLSQNKVPEGLLQSFSRSSLCHTGLENGGAEIATDFVGDAEGFVRFEFAAGGVNELRRSILLRRLLEIETYAKLALLGLPLVRSAGGELHALETDISEVISGLPNIRDIGAARGAIDRLNALSLAIAALTDRLSYRLAASQAYGQIVGDRLRVLEGRALGTASSLSVYLSNRIEPAMRTIRATERRLDDAARRIERTVMMLNARNGLELEVQNSEILGTISRTAKSQFRLQQTVEGLSVIAITYYLVGIIGYALDAPLHAMEWSKSWVMAGITPLALIGVWFASRRLWSGRRKDD